jgi:hypothetical protein
MRPYLITAKLMRPSNMKRFPTPGLAVSPRPLLLYCYQCNVLRNKAFRNWLMCDFPVLFVWTTQQIIWPMCNMTWHYSKQATCNCNCSEAYQWLPSILNVRLCPNTTPWTCTVHGRCREGGGDKLQASDPNSCCFTMGIMVPRTL